MSSHAPAWLAAEPALDLPSAGSTVIAATGLSLGYGTKTVLTGVDLSVTRGKITALIGPSGCGKTSFLSCLNRLTDLIPGGWVKGQLVVLGEDVLAPALDVVALRRRIGMIFQKPNPFPLSIAQNVLWPLREHGVHRAERERILVEVLQDVGLWDEVKDRLKTSALALSGGQQQRLCIARALALAPQVILFDEPTSALDPLSSAVIEDLIVGLRGRYTTVIVTHNLAQARRIGDFVAVFWVQDGVGRLIEAGPAAQILTHPQNELTRAYVSGARG